MARPSLLSPELSALIGRLAVDHSDKEIQQELHKHGAHVSIDTVYRHKLKAQAAAATERPVGPKVVIPTSDPDELTGIISDLRALAQDATLDAAARIDALERAGYLALALRKMEVAT